MNAEEMAVKPAEVDARSKSNTHRLDEMGEKVDTIEKKPAKWWNGGMLHPETT